jgi:hypothetical protein
MTPLLAHNLEVLARVHWSAMLSFAFVFVACLIGMAAALRSKALTLDHFRTDPFGFIAPTLLALMLAIPLAWSGVTLGLWLFANYCWKA